MGRTPPRGPGKALIRVTRGGASACGPQDPPLGRKLVAPDRAGLVDAKASPYLKAHMKDGRLYVFSKWTVNGAARAVSGTGRQWEIDRVRWADGTFELPLDAVSLFETNKPIDTPPSVAPLPQATRHSPPATA